MLVLLGKQTQRSRVSVQDDAAWENQERLPRGVAAESCRTNQYAQKCIQRLG